MPTRPHSARKAVGGVLAVAFALFLTACQSESSGPAPSAPAASSRSEGDAPPAPTAGDEGAWDTAPDSIAAVGDSITRAFDACGPLADCPRASWATGSDPAVDSLADRLLDHPRRSSWNLAENGAVMADLPDQMARATGHGPELVTVLAGANDACRPTVGTMTPVADFRADFAEALRTLWRESPETQVYVASIPDLERLWRVGRGSPEARRVWGLGVCRSMLQAPQSTGGAAAERRKQVSERVAAYNAALREVCRDAPAEHRCRWDGGAVHDHRFTADALSRWDWFHPSLEGQSALAELAHERITR